MNKSVRRKHPYQWSNLIDIQNLPLEQLIDRTRSSLICCWSTNCDKIEEFIKNDLFQKWNCQYLTTWYWLKVDWIDRTLHLPTPFFQVTQSGESVLDLTSIDKKSYETLILGYTANDDKFQSLKGTRKIISSVNESSRISTCNPIVSSAGTSTDSFDETSTSSSLSNAHWLSKYGNRSLSRSVCTKFITKFYIHRKWSKR